MENKKYYKIVLDQTGKMLNEITYLVGFNGENIHANRFEKGKTLPMTDGNIQADSLVIGNKGKYDLLTLSDSHKIIQFKNARILKMRSGYNESVGGKIIFVIEAETALKTNCDLSVA